MQLLHTYITLCIAYILGLILELAETVRLRRTVKDFGGALRIHEVRILSLLLMTTTRLMQLLPIHVFLVYWIGKC